MLVFINLRLRTWAERRGHSFVIGNSNNKKIPRWGIFFIVGTPNGLAYATLQNSPCGGTGVIPPFCCGSNTMVHGFDSREYPEKIKTPKTVFFIFWHSQWESNPCCRNENPMSWTARRWEHSFIATQRYPMFGKMSTLFAAFFI